MYLTHIHIYTNIRRWRAQNKTDSNSIIFKPIFLKIVWLETSIVKRDTVYFLERNSYAGQMQTLI